jgi:hypothetical protein
VAIRAWLQVCALANRFTVEASQLGAGAARTSERSGQMEELLDRQVEGAGEVDREREAGREPAGLDRNDGATRDPDELTELLLRQPSLQP